MTASPPSTTHTLPAAFLYGPRDLRIGPQPLPGPPAHTEVQISVTSVGICGSDLHTYLDGRIGDTSVTTPLILGHEFAGRIDAVGGDLCDGRGLPLRVGDRVAVEPAIACGRCECCEIGNPNLCVDHTFCGVAPRHGALQSNLNLPAANCFRVPDEIGDDAAAMLEPLGVALHAIDLAHIKPGYDVFVVGAGAVGLLCAQLALVSGAARVWISDRHAWRLDLAERFGAIPLDYSDADPAQGIRTATRGRGVDVTLEAAWSDEDAMTQAIDALRPGGRLVVVGIAGDDRLTFCHSSARRKGLTLAMCRRMKHTYPRAIQLAARRRVDLDALVTHRFGLERASDAIDLAAGYRDGVIRAMVHI